MTWRKIITCILWDCGRALGLPLMIHPEDGDPSKAILPQVLAIQVAILARKFDPEFRPVYGTRAALKIIFRAIFGPYILIRFRHWCLRRRLSKMAGMTFRTDRAALAFLDFLAAELARQDTPQI